MTDQEFDFLRSPEGAALLAVAVEWVAAGDPVRAVAALRREHPPEQVAAALEQAELRRRARAKFADADRMLFTRAGLEQASGDRVARWRAGRYNGHAVVADLCCGIGGDTRVLAEARTVVAVDRDPLHVRLAAWNARVCGPAPRPESAETCGCRTTAAIQNPKSKIQNPVWPVVGEVPALTPRVGAAFLDPGRREGGRRTRKLSEMSPPISAVVALAARIPDLGVKLSPALDERELSGVLGSLSYELEYLSDGGECKEAVLWLGGLRTAARRASRVDAGVTLPVEPHFTGAAGRESIPVGPIGAYLFEPDPAAIRAGAIEPLAAEHGLRKLEEEIAYLTGDRPVVSPWLTGYRVLEVMPFGLKPLRAAVRARGVADVVVKKRGSAVEPESFRRRLLAGLPGAGTGSVVVFLTRHRGRHVALVAEAVGNSGGSRRGTAGGGAFANG